MSSKSKIKEILGVTPDTIPKHVFTSSVPIILRDLVTHWPLVKANSIKECIDDILKYYQGAPIHAFSAKKETNGRYFYNEDLSELNFTQYPVKFDEFLKQLNTPLSSYMYVGSANIDRLLPKFKNTHSLSALSNLNPLSSIWLGNQSRIAAHQDMPNNIACCVKGQRRFTLFPPNQIENLYIGPLDFTPAGQAISLVDFHQPNYQKFPKFKIAQDNAFIIDLNPGDALYIPSMWWHHVEAFSQFNILINFWWNTNSSVMGEPVDSLLHALLNIKELPQEQKNAWKALFDYYIFNDNKQALSHIPQDKLGILNTKDELSFRKIRAMLLNKLNK
ncbi:cupin-like domain-containing protein [Colwellia sp. UCD-KL20]|uniref:cupin-like domain-containing protein n=1 Tax=Colwellia sp. UCD-KL20 TaxID=1917165 RepID=UPI0009706CBC|nr:cupin-like domain-containing protein [Colwellia sp. UCD-KL20]